MTAAELCFVAAALIFLVNLHPTFAKSGPLQQLAFALLAFGLALISGLAFRLGLEGDIF
jgi:hypothetical protein